MLRTSFFLLLLAVASCAGPADPFGPIEKLEVIDIPKVSEVQNYAKINFIPSKQISHRSHDFKVTIDDPKGIGRNHKLKVLYNDHYISDELLAKTRKTLSPDGKNLTIDFGILRFLPDRDNVVIVSYQRDEKSGLVAKQFHTPQCSIDDYKVVSNYDGFDDQTERFNLIERIARRYNVNPSLLSALVAQESSFDPQAVSWAKALGLTQVTTVASKQIEKKTLEWPRHRGIASMSVPTLKWFILKDEINEKNEWRLNEELSLRGGVEFLKYLDEYWQKEDNEEVLSASFGDKIPWTEILLASYNSGAYNVKKAVKRNGKEWIKARHLKEARKYVNRIKSYCFTFSDKR